MIQKFIDRPVLSTVISIVIVLMGLVSLTMLPITQYPDVAPPMIKVSTMYPGANADVVINSVIAPLEEKINGVENMTYISSSARNDGSAEIEVYFKLGVDPDMASVYVQNRVASASSSLPAEVNRMGVTTTKMQNSMLLVLKVSSTNPTHDETFLQNYARINVLPQLQRVSGVGDVKVFGARDYSMRVWLQPEKLAAYNLQPSDVAAAIQEQSMEAAPGKFGSQSDQVFEYTIKYKGRLKEISEYENIIIRTEENGEILRLKDVARIEFGAYDYSVTSNSKGNPAAVMAVYQTKGSNSQQIINTVKGIMSDMKIQMPPGMEYSYVMDTQEFLDESISSVVHTLIEAFILVFIVVFVFLQNVKSTLIPAISAVVAMVGTFFFLQIFGFSINLLTLFALVLSIGIVVDDAIVVVEAVHAKMEGDPDISVRDATKSAMGEITGAIISITLVFMAVFIPVTFMQGSSGVFYQQFAITLAVAVVLSAINALTLSPALCAIFIKRHDGTKKSGNVFKRLGKSFDAGFGAMTAKYTKFVGFLIHKRGAMIVMMIGIAAVTGYMMFKTPSGFIPTEDQGVFFVDVTMPEGTTLERTEVVLQQVDSILSTMPVVRDQVTICGVGMISGAFGGSYGMCFAKLVHWDERKDTDLGKILGEFYAKIGSIKDAKILAFVPPTVSGFGNSDGFELRLKDQSGGSVNNMYQVSINFIEALSKRPEIAYASSSFSVNFPQLEMIVDVNKCKLMGVAVSDVFAAMQGYYGSQYVGDFNKFTKFYRVMMQAEPNSRKDVSSVSNIMVRNNQGQMVPLTTMVEFKRVYGSELITRFNLFNSVSINGKAGDGYSSGDAIAAIAEVAKTSLPNDFSYEFSGITRDEIESGGQMTFILILSFTLVYLILCALYESYILPLAVVLSIVFGVFGVFLTINLIGLDNNIYVQIALVMLMGLLAKNAILIVEFAKMRREEGLSVYYAAKEGAKERLRPILMTSFAFIFGLLPLCLSRGAGAAGNVSIGFAAAGGFLIATILGVLLIPTLFYLFETLHEKVSGIQFKDGVQGDMSGAPEQLDE